MSSTGKIVNGVLPLISVGIPVYNVEPYIEKCLLSVLNQTYERLEILAVDDLGTDQSMQIVERLIDSHPRGSQIRIIKHTQNKGLSEARNTAIKECKGEYIYFLDSDDYMELNAIEVLYAQAKEHKTDIVIASHRMVAFDTGVELPTFHNSTYRVIKGKDAFANFVCADLRWHVTLMAWNVLFTTDFIRKNSLQFFGRKDEDSLFFSDYYSAVESAVIMPDITYNYVARPGSIMGYMSSRTQIPIKEIRERFRTDACMTEHCARVKGRRFYDVHCAKVVKHKFRAVCVALRHRKRFTEPLPSSEIHQELKHPATLGEILKFKRYKLFHLYFYTISKLPPSLSVGVSYLTGRALRWI